jgi:hypothetical protein
MAHHYAYMKRVAEVCEPESYEEAAEDANWRTAMEEEMRALAENETWDLVDAPKGVKPIGCRWVYKIKYNADGSINRYKPRLVAKGYAQKHGIDYDEMFAPIAKITTVRVLLAVAAAKGWHLHQMDVKNAFLEGELEEQVYMVQPPGFHSKTNSSAVCQLKKSLYGLKQTPRAWNTKITQQLLKMSFETSKADSSLFVRKTRLGPMSILLYVDDLIITGADLDEINHVRRELGASFDMKDLGDLHYFLGIEVIRTPDGILISQRHYALGMLFKFGMANCKLISMPPDRTVKHRPDSGRVCDPTRFRRIVGSLIYLTIT